MTSTIAFVRLSTIAPAEIAAHMNAPGVAAHLPLYDGPWDEAAAARFIAAKEARWAADGLGHWAIRAGGEYVGWGGFQKDGGAWDYGLVLRPERFGLGSSITRKASAFARQDPRIAVVTFLLPPTRVKLRAMARIGAAYVGETTCEGVVFHMYRLETR